MIARNALYTFIEALIDGSELSDALSGAESFRNLRGDVNTAAKIVRVDVLDGVMAVTDEPIQQEQGVGFTIQFWCTPEGTELTDLDDAKDTSFDMARQFFDALHENQSLSGAVCLADADVFETGEANLGATLRGVTYLDGEVNPVGQG